MTPADEDNSKVVAKNWDKLQNKVFYLSKDCQRYLKVSVSISIIVVFNSLDLGKFGLRKKVSLLVS